MGLFDFLKKKNKEASTSNKILLAMPLFLNSDRYDLVKVTNHIKGFWDIDVSTTGDNDSAILEINGERIALAFMDMPVPKGDIEGTAKYAYNWETVLEDLQGHDGHSIVSILTTSTPVIDRFLLLSKVLFSILMTSNAIGVYKGSQSLLIPRDQYIDMAEGIKNGEFPIPLWVYIGLHNNGSKNSAYSYGLTLFGKREVEVVDSECRLDELYDFVANITSYVIANDVTLKNGETIGLSEDQRIKIEVSAGHNVEGISMKLKL